jgi:TM2 domain-containing membrane protein YozV
MDVDKYTRYIKPSIELPEILKGSQTIATLLSSLGAFIPVFAGSGQIYKGQVKRGVAISIIQTINFLLIFVLIGVITYPIGAMYAIYDAYTNYPVESD